LLRLNISKAVVFERVLEGINDFYKASDGLALIEVVVLVQISCVKLRKKGENGTR
jgi:hypothetical protein